MSGNLSQPGSGSVSLLQVMLRRLHCTLRRDSNVQEEGGVTVSASTDSKLWLPLYPYSRRDGLGQSPTSPVEAV